MTTQDHGSGTDRVVATFSNGEAARRASMSMEQLGIESARVHVEVASDLRGHVPESHADAAAVERPRHLAFQGMIIGGVVGAVVGVIVGSVSDVVPMVMAVALFVIPGVVLGAMFGVYSRLQTNTEITDADAGGPVMLTIDLTALDDAEREAAVERLRAEQPIRLVAG